MPQRTRRLLRGFAFVVFFVLTPVVVLTTSGWHWTGWRTGWRQTGVILVSSIPRASIVINGKASGQTPKRLPSLTPGTYRLVLERAGYRPWSHLITVRPRAATVLGPVTLWPNALAEVPVGAASESVPSWLVDDARSTIFSLHADGSTWRAEGRWPLSTNMLVNLVEKPTSLSVGPRGQVIILTGPSQSLIITGRGAVDWQVRPVEQPTWSGQTDSLFFGRQDGQLLRFDSVTQTIVMVGEVTGFTVVGETLWFTREEGQNTMVFRQSINGPAPTIPWRTYRGRWEILPDLPDRLVLRQTVTHEAEYISFSRLSPEPLPIELGSVDRLFWLDTGQPPLWQSGVNVYTLSKNRPQLLERLAYDYEQLTWFVPGHSILGFDQTAFAVNGVSGQQGHGALEERLFQPGQQPLLLDLRQESLLVADGPNHRLVRWSWSPDLVTADN